MRETRWWTLHVVAGAAILVLLGLHMLVMHLDKVLGWFVADGEGPLVWASVLRRSQMGFFVIVYVLLLGAALYHGLYGLRTIILEYGPCARLARPLAVLFWLVGLALFALGAWATIAVKLGAGA